MKGRTIFYTAYITAKLFRGNGATHIVKRSTEKMSLDDCKRFQALSHLHSEILSEEEDGIFSYGFTLGLLIVMNIAEEARLMIGE